mgnify:CR=1 FL=1|jgi:hypothetical protein
MGILVFFFPLGTLWGTSADLFFFFSSEVDRAIDNLVKSGKLWNAPRRDSMPMMMGRPYPDYGMLRARMTPRTRF